MLRWFETGGVDSDVVIASRVRLARNIKGFKFSYKLEEDDEKRLIADIVSKLEKVEPFKNYNYFNYDYLDTYQKMGMKERNVISSFLEKQAQAAGFVAPNEDISIMVNEEDHIRIQSFMPGRNLSEAYEAANRMDDIIGNTLDYAYDADFGYLTTLPSNAGTGMRASFLLHLPALTAADGMEGLIPEVGRFGLALRPVEGSNNAAWGDIYQLSNQATLGKSERDIIESLNNIAEQIIAQERQCRQQYISKRKVTALDFVFRSYGVLKYARKITLSDGMLMLSQIRFGLAERIVHSELGDENLIYQLMIGIHPANLLILGNRRMSEEELDMARADFLREHLPTIE